MNLRIALSGSAGTGKTTLGKRLAAELGLPFIQEGMRDRIEAGLELHELSRAEQHALVEELWSEQFAREEAASDGFVVDRSSYDFAAFWLHYDFHIDRGATDEWIDRMVSAAARYDHVLLLPWGVLPLEHDGVRSTNRWTQFRYHALLEGVLGRFATGDQVVRVPGTSELAERVRYVRRLLGA